MRKSKKIKVGTGAMILFFFLTGVVTGETYEHEAVQSVDDYGVGNHPGLTSENKISVEGIILNRPEFMLSADPCDGAPYGPGASWQIYIQGEGDDHAGTAVWMGQCYDNIYSGVGTYSNQEWMAEVYRVTHDSDTGHAFAPGDRVRVTGLLKYYNGKTNINELHKTDPDNDLTIELLQAQVGLPEPEEITLDKLKDQDGFIFDPNRLTGCEYYQSRMVRVNNVQWDSDPNTWDADATLKITDGTHTFPVKLGIGWGINRRSNNLTATFDVIGILDQEGPGITGYRIWVTNYDGNGQVLAQRGTSWGYLPGDSNKDGQVDLQDMALMAEYWLDECMPGTPGCGGW